MLRDHTEILLASRLHRGLGAMTPEELKARLGAWAADVVVLCGQLRARPEARHVSDQLLASATSASANYRAACRARSRREFVAKLGVAVEEADESVGWMKILTDSGLAESGRMSGLLGEARQLLAILAASRRTALQNLQRTAPGTPRRQPSD